MKRAQARCLQPNQTSAPDTPEQLAAGTSKDAAMEQYLTFIEEIKKR